MAALQEMQQLQQNLELLKQCQSLQVELDKMLELKRLQDEQEAIKRIEPYRVVQLPAPSSMSNCVVMCGQVL